MKNIHETERNSISFRLRLIISARSRCDQPSVTRVTKKWQNPQPTVIQELLISRSTCSNNKITHEYTLDKLLAIIRFWHNFSKPRDFAHCIWDSITLKSYFSLKPISSDFHHITDLQRSTRITPWQIGERILWQIPHQTRSLDGFTSIPTLPIFRLFIIADFIFCHFSTMCFIYHLKLDRLPNKNHGENNPQKHTWKCVCLSISHSSPFNVWHTSGEIRKLLFLTTSCILWLPPLHALSLSATFLSFTDTITRQSSRPRAPQTLKQRCVAGKWEN